jgi:hypothetical protein
MVRMRRPETHGLPAEEQLRPSKNGRHNLVPGWATKIVAGLIAHLHSAVELRLQSGSPGLMGPNNRVEPSAGSTLRCLSSIAAPTPANVERSEAPPTTPLIGTGVA